MSTKAGSRWERNTWAYLKQLVVEVPEAGIHFQSKFTNTTQYPPGDPYKIKVTEMHTENRIYRRHKDLAKLQDGSASMLNNVFAEKPHYKDFVEDYRDLRSDELPNGVASGAEFTSVCINTMIYLPWLTGQCRRNGVTFHRGIVGHVAEIRSFPGKGGKVDVVINTTGLGARKLGGVMDQTMMPIRGQTVVVRNVAPFMQIHSGTDEDEEACYMMTRAAGGGTILGGTTQVGNWESQPDVNIATRIMKRAVEVMPELTGGKGVEHLDIIRHGVGLRPGREDGVRLEKEKIDGTWVVHNYGHSGWGYQGSYGCAEEVVSLVGSIASKSKL